MVQQLGQVTVSGHFSGSRLLGSNPEVGSQLCRQERVTPGQSGWRGSAAKGFTTRRISAKSKRLAPCIREGESGFTHPLWPPLFRPATNCDFAVRLRVPCTAETRDRIRVRGTKPLRIPFGLLGQLAESSGRPADCVVHQLAIGGVEMCLVVMPQLDVNHA